MPRKFPIVSFRILTIPPTLCSGVKAYDADAKTKVVIAAADRGRLGVGHQIFAARKFLRLDRIAPENAI